ncbi:MAG TPA: DUF3649 domain-containing protein [Azoarcus taiwanensis]|nr:DUF3649 domain-containing protein [Azoarcus taiwanensis]
MNRLAIPSRILAAALGGYALANSGAILLAAALPGGQAEAVTWGLLASFLIYTAAVMWVFSVRSALRAWLGVLVPGLVCGALAWILMQGGTP